MDGKCKGYPRKRQKKILSENTKPGSPHGAGFRADNYELTTGNGLPGGEGGIRTHGTPKRTTVFETVRFNHSRTSPSDCFTVS